jgi:hypothetical protein
MSTTPSSSSASGLLPERAVPSVQVIPLRFTGSGSEYFRIWIVNSLLLVLTLGLYMPWARVRKLRYVYGNTVVQGIDDTDAEILAATAGEPKRNHLHRRHSPLRQQPGCRR